MCGDNKPMQLGPKMRSNCGFAASNMACFCSRVMPAVSTTAARVPKAASCVIKPTTVLAGVHITAKSGTAGKSAAFATTV